jgi:hypothetical protein
MASTCWDWSQRDSIDPTGRTFARRVRDVWPADEQTPDALAAQTKSQNRPSVADYRGTWHKIGLNLITVGSGEI